MRTLEVAWAAGFLDGEGCFQVADRGGRYDPQLIAAQVVRAPLDKLVELFGGSVCLSAATRPRQRPCFRWSLHSARAMRDTLPELIPYLIVKREEAERLLDLANLIAPVGTYHTGKSVPLDLRRRQRVAADAVRAVRQAAKQAA